MRYKSVKSDMSILLQILFVRTLSSFMCRRLTDWADRDQPQQTELTDIPQKGIQNVRCLPHLKTHIKTDRQKYKRTKAEANQTSSFVLLCFLVTMSVFCLTTTTDISLSDWVGFTHTNVPGRLQPLFKIADEIEQGLYPPTATTTITPSLSMLH